MANKCALCVRYDALGEDTDGNLGIKNKAYMDGRLKLLESGGKVIQPFAQGGQKKWKAKADGKGYNEGDDFVQSGESKKKRTKYE